MCSFGLKNKNDEEFKNFFAGIRIFKRHIESMYHCEFEKKMHEVIKNKREQ